MNRTLIYNTQLYVRRTSSVHFRWIDLGAIDCFSIYWIFFEISDETKAEIDDDEEEAVVSFSERYYNTQQTARSDRGPGFIGHSHSQGLDHSQQYGNTGYGVSSPEIQN